MTSPSGGGARRRRTMVSVWRAAAPALAGLVFLLGGGEQARGQPPDGGGTPAPATGSQEVRPLTLDEALQMALERNPWLRAARAEALAADAVHEQVRAAQWPALRSQAGYTRLSGNIPGVELTVPGTDSTVTFQAVELDRLRSEVSVEVPLLTQLRLRHETRAAGYEAEAAELAAGQERADLAYEVRRAYWTLYRASAALDAVDAARVRMEAHLADVRARLDEGTVLPRDLLTTRTRLSEVRLEGVEADNAVRVARLELNRLVGLPLDTPVLTATEIEVGPLEIDSGLPAPAVVDGRPQIGALARQVRGLREEVLAARAARLPEVGFVGRYVYARPNPYFFSEQDAFRATWELGLSARWAIWEGGRMGARERETEARLEAAEARLAATRERVAVNVARARLEVRRADEAMEVAARAVEEAEESYRVVQAQFGEGAALVSDVLDAEEALREARLREVDARVDRAVARAALLNALGRVR